MAVNISTDSNKNITVLKDSAYSLGPKFRMNAGPLDTSEYFSSFEAAESYAAGDEAVKGSLAYVGELITVIEGSAKDGVYIINSDSGLDKLVDDKTLSAIIETKVEQLNAGIANTGYQGSIKEMPATIKKGMVFSTNEPDLNDFASTYLDNVTLAQLKTEAGLEAGDWLVAKKDASITDIKNTIKLTEVFGVWEKNLTGAVTGLNGGSNESGKYISSIIKNDDVINVTKTDLPVKSVEVNGSGNAITGFTYNNGNITVTKSNISTKQYTLVRHYWTSNTGDHPAGYFPFTIVEVEGEKTAQLDLYPFFFPPTQSGQKDHIVLENVTKEIGAYIWEDIPQEYIDYTNVTIYMNGVLLESGKYRDYEFKDGVMFNNKTGAGIEIHPSCGVDKNDVFTVCITMPELYVGSSPRVE